MGLIIRSSCLGVASLAFCLFIMALSVQGITHSDEDDLILPSLAASFDYKDALSKATLFFQGQRSGKLPGSQRVTWRGNSALSDGKPDGVCKPFMHILTNN